MPRVPDSGITLGHGVLDPLNASGMRVGHTTMNADFANGHRVRSGVTVSEPAQRTSPAFPCFSGVPVLKGNGDATGLKWIREAGLLTSPSAFTHSLGVVPNSLIALARETLP